MDSRKKRGDYAKAFEDGSETRVLLHALSKQVMGEVRPSLEQHARVDHLQTLSDERDAALSRLRGTCGITSSNSQASTSPSFLPANPKLFWRVRLRLVELTNDQARERDAALEWRPCDRRSVEVWVRVWVRVREVLGFIYACLCLTVGSVARLHKTGQVAAGERVDQSLGVPLAPLRRTDPGRHGAQSQVRAQHMQWGTIGSTIAL